MTEYKEYASKSLKMWFPHWSDDRVLEEVNNIRTKNTINMNRLIREMYYLNNVLNKYLAKKRPVNTDLFILLFKNYL